MLKKEASHEAFFYKKKNETMKNKKAILGLFTLAIVAVSCTRQKQASAVIFERKVVDSSHILIKYRYHVKDVQYVDSATIPNQVIAGDSIAINHSNSTPGKSTPVPNN
jgi:hypothetical protein